ncbi:MAG: hypothetical protein R3E31_19955 [Chloroflexota bacterium]
MGNGRCPRGGTAVSQTLKDKPMDSQSIEIKAGFCEEVIETIGSFWEQLIKVVQETKISSQHSKS